MIHAAYLSMPTDTAGDPRADVPCNNLQLREACTPGGDPGSTPKRFSPYKTKGALRYRLSETQSSGCKGLQRGVLLIQLEVFRDRQQGQAGKQGTGWLTECLADLVTQTQRCLDGRKQAFKVTQGARLWRVLRQEEIKRRKWESCWKICHNICKTIWIWF